MLLSLSFLHHVSHFWDPKINLLSFPHFHDIFNQQLVLRLVDFISFNDLDIQTDEIIVLGTWEEQISEFVVI